MKSSLKPTLKLSLKLQSCILFSYVILNVSVKPMRDEYHPFRAYPFCNSARPGTRSDFVHIAQYFL